jgi:amidohydrolase
VSELESKYVSRRAVLGGMVGVGLSSSWPMRPASAADRDQDAVRDRDGDRDRDRDLIELRRDIHRHPEAPGQERRTAGLVAERLRAAGLDVTTGVGGHGVVGMLTGHQPGRTVAYRADLDAVPPSDQIEGGSQPAHVCGHDLHTAIAVGIAEKLARRRDRLAGTVGFIFQPAEENLTGAAAMLDAGVLTLVQPAEIHALHCYSFPVGQFRTMGGFGLPGQDRGVVTVTGPDAPARAERLAAQINALGTVPPPASPADLARVVRQVQRPHSPLARFIFMRAGAEDATIRVSYRCWPENRYLEIRDRIGALARSSGPATVSFPDAPVPAMVCPEREGRAIQRYLGAPALHAAIPFSSEDFALFLDRIPGTYTLLGVRRPGAAIETSYPHYGAFNPDERAIGHGVRAMAGWLASRTAVAAR